MDDRTIAQSILRRAQEAIDAGTEKHGDASESFRMIGELWSIYLSHTHGKVLPHDVAHMMSLLKIARAVYSYDEDNYIDEAGYAALAAMLNSKGPYMNKLLEETGVHVLVDGQFGSTGKGALASHLARAAVNNGDIENFIGSISSSGPNSGHTSYSGHAKVVLKQLPTFGVHAALLGHPIPIYLSAGAIIHPDVLRAEAMQNSRVQVFVHPNAVVVNKADKDFEMEGSIAAIASTQSGTGAALARKVLRAPNVIARESLKNMPPNVSLMTDRFTPEKGAYFMEIAQGFSLGIHSEFYPHVTSRECTVMQGLADARIPPRLLAKTYMCVRTFPIRVGNLGEHSSGGWYHDQEETSWETIHQKPELTTVTKRVRRVATFSMQQFIDAIRANDPDWVGLNFLNYLGVEDRELFLEDIRAVREEMEQSNGKHFDLLAGIGPSWSDWGPIP